MSPSKLATGRAYELKIKKCAQCGRVIKNLITPSKFKRAKFCGFECYGLYERKSQKGAGNHNYRNAGNKTCAECGKTFRNYKTKAKYCSNTCSLHNPNMPRNIYRRGVKYEYDAIKILRAEGWDLVSRAPASKGVFDIMAIGLNPFIKYEIRDKANVLINCSEAPPGAVQLKFVQVKSTRVHKTLQAVVRAKERTRIIEFAENAPAYISCEIWIRFVGKEWKRYRYNPTSQQYEELTIQRQEQT